MNYTATAPIAWRKIRTEPAAGGRMSREIACPVCSADVPLGGDERRGDEVFCGACRAPLKLTADYGDEDLEAEEDF